MAKRRYWLRVIKTDWKNVSKFVAHWSRLSGSLVVSSVLVVGVLLVTQLNAAVDKPIVPPEPDMITFSSPAPLPLGPREPAPAVSAKNVFVMDRASKSVLLTKASQDRVYPASTTKMMTAVVALEQFSLDQVIAVKYKYPIGLNMGFSPGEQLTVEQLLYALLVQSANDAAEILAEGYLGGRPAFVAAMNTQAEKWHLADTHFVNPTGIDELDHYSSAVDLVRLADAALDNPEFAKVVSVENAVLSSQTLSRSYVLTNINQLLGRVAGVQGVKTGFTQGAGQSLVTVVDRDGHQVLLAVLGSDDRFADTERLIDWVYINFTWVDPASLDMSNQPPPRTP